jgi:NTE family protein
VVDPGSGEGARWAGMRTHRIMTEMLSELGASSKLNAEWDFVSLLRDEGRRAAAAFLDAHGGDIGVRSTADIDVLLSEC